MRCNQISAIKDKPTRHSIETSSFRFVQFLQKRQNQLIAISGDELESLLIERYFACQFGAFRQRKFVFPITQRGIDESLLSFADLSFCHMHPLYSARLNTSTLPMAELIEQERMFPRYIVPSNRHHWNIPPTFKNWQLNCPLKTVILSFLVSLFRPIFTEEDEFTRTDAVLPSRPFPPCLSQSLSVNSLAYSKALPARWPLASDTSLHSFLRHEGTRKNKAPVASPLLWLFPRSLHKRRPAIG